VNVVVDPAGTGVNESVGAVLKFDSLMTVRLPHVATDVDIVHGLVIVIDWDPAFLIITRTVLPAQE